MLVRRSWDIFQTSSGFGHRTPYFGIFPVSSSLLALAPFVDPLQSLPLTLHGRTIAFVRKQLSVISRLLAVICDPVSLIGDAISFVSDPLAPRELTLTPGKRVRAVIAFALSIQMILTDHDLL
ncbi:MAG: hypothetical protein JO259_14515 [Mycobacterium sp.]|nr:hypothetical protein [Mycobacterium sp.]